MLSLTIIDCRTCGACCSYSSAWPRFTLETDAAIALIPSELLDSAKQGMKCKGDRCSALAGTVAVSVHCTIYAERPDVCRACLPGDEACQMARAQFKLEPIAPYFGRESGSSSNQSVSSHLLTSYGGIG